VRTARIIWRAQAARPGWAARHNGGVTQLPRFWLFMQIAIVICVLISAVIVIIKL
jgi:hypothetical protein